MFDIRYAQKEKRNWAHLHAFYCALRKEGEQTERKTISICRTRSRNRLNYLIYLYTFETLEGSGIGSVSSRKQVAVLVFPLAIEC